MRKIITEINRIREMIGVSLIVEGIGDVLNIFTNLGKKSIKELSNEEQEIISKLIKDSAEIQRAGIRSIDDVMSDAGKQLLLKTIRENSVAVKSTFNKIVSDYAKTSMTMINSNLKSIPDLETELSKLKAGPNTALDLIQKIEKEGTENLDTLQLAALKKTLTDAKTTFAGNLRMTTYLDDVSEQVDGVIKAKNVDVNIESAGTKTTKTAADEIAEEASKKITASQQQSILDGVNKMSDDEAQKVLDDIKNGKGSFEPQKMVKAGFDLEAIKKATKAVFEILSLPIEGVFKLLEAFRVIPKGVVGPKVYLYITMTIFVGIVGWQLIDWWFLGGEPPIKIDTSNIKLFDSEELNCIQRVQGSENLNKDMLNYAAINFGCAKTKDATGNDKISGFAIDENNLMVVVYPNCQEKYSVDSGGGTGKKESSTCEESNMGGGDEENSEESTGSYENNETDFNRWLGIKGWSGIWDSSLPEVTDNSGEPQLYEFKNGEWVLI